ncbi:MAG: hypothetical protein ACC608_10100 [Anaerofustis sp.]
MSTLSNISSFFNEILPIFGFLLLLSGILFLVFLKNKLELYFLHIESMSSDMRRIANHMDDESKYRY